MTGRLLVALLACAFIAGCTAGYHPLPGDPTGPVHGESGGGGGGGM
jgi:hypothetical protein